MRFLMMPRWAHIHSGRERAGISPHLSLVEIDLLSHVYLNITLRGTLGKKENGCPYQLRQVSIGR
jgi:hypothetical protein